ncbi:MAG: flagellin [Actinomycetota bacterium]|jgi:flagellin|nr:flagellin [Actinomycetota bacterium]MDI7251823.1 flagellin [Actinomycetota bacterium]
MALRINQNIAAYNAHRNLTLTDSLLSKSLERLSSGLRINRAADDAAGLSISEKLRSQVRGLQQAVRNAQDGISLIQTAEGALQETHAILQRMRELAVQAANGTLTDADRQAIQSEVSNLINEVTRIANSTKFNGEALLNGGLGSSITVSGSSLNPQYGISNIESLGAAAGTYYLSFVASSNELTLSDGTNSETLRVTVPSGEFETSVVTFSSFSVAVTINSALTADIASGNGAFDVTAGAMSLHIGAYKDETITVSVGDMRASALGIDSLDVSSISGAEAAIESLDSAINQVSEQRSNLGAVQNRLEHTIANLGVAVENISASESRIRDVDMAAEMVNFTRQQIMIQAGTAMLAQANAVPQTVLQLLR